MIPLNLTVFRQTKVSMAKGPIPGAPEPESPATRAPKEPVAEGPSRAGSPSTDAGAGITDDLHDRMLGEFRILRRIGRGGMAEVYLAEQTLLARNVAIKVLHKERVADESYLKRFKTEAMAAGSLSHPNIVQVIMIGEQDGIQYIAQEYVPGMNLREFITRKGPPELAVALRIIRQVASALQAAHNAGIVHRDIKPENIMITRKGDVKVADFGLAQLTQGGERVNLTQDGVTMGTPLYMSPEQVNGSKLDLRTDIYSLGVTCYHMLAGSPPFRGETAMSIAVQHLKQDPEPLENIRADLPPLLCRIVHKMMAKEIDRRYQTAQAVLKDLKRVTADGEQAGDHPTTDHELPVAHNAPGAHQSTVVRLVSGVWRVGDWPVWRQVATVLALALLVGAASAGVGWITRVPNPLEAPLDRTRAAAVPRKDKAASQYFYALSVKDDIPAWRAVIEYFPESENRLIRNYAKQHLATLYLTRDRYDDAQAIFDEFAGFGESEPEWRAFGLAGQAVVLHQRGDYRQSQQVLDKLKPLYGKLDDKMRMAVEETIQRNVARLDQQLSKEWEDIFKKHQHPEGTPSGN